MLPPPPPPPPPVLFCVGGTECAAAVDAVDADAADAGGSPSSCATAARLESTQERNLECWSSEVRVSKARVASCLFRENTIHGPRARTPYSKSVSVVGTVWGVKVENA